MAHFRGQCSAFGAPGCEPRWTDGDKDGIGTACSTGGRVWFTIRRGILTEIYHPTIDRPQLRDIEFLFADGDGRFLEERRDLESDVVRLRPSQGYQITGRDRERGFLLTKEVIVEPDRHCVLLHAKLGGDPAMLEALKTYLLCAPHLDGEGAGNNAFIVEAY